MQELNK